MRAATIAVTFFAVAVGLGTLSAEPPRHTVERPEGYVPDAATAIKIAVAVWEPIYGRKHIAGKRPFRATLHGTVWSVRGSLPKGYLGGVPEADIAKKDGRILRISHGR